MKALLALLLLAAPAGARPLGISEAISTALERNVAARVARAQDEAARGRALLAAAEMLPRLTGTVSQDRVFRQNLAALGLSGGGGFPLLIGPYDVFDARARLALDVLDASSWRKWSAARARGRAAQAEEALAAQQVAGAAALAYIEAVRAREAIRAATAGVALAKELERLALDRRSAGTAMGLDVARAQSRGADETLRLIEARTASAAADLRLKRVVGLPLSEEIEPSDPLVERSTAGVTMDSAVSAALAARPELTVAEARLEAAGLDVSARRWERAPKVSLRAEAGELGNLPDREARLTGSIGAELRMPLFDWRNTARIRESSAAREESQARFEDLRQAVEQDARLAVETLEQSAERVEASRLSETLARRELELARGRFEAGLGDNLELADAQTALARAEDRLAAALASLQTARVNLALATGSMKEFSF